MNSLQAAGHWQTLLALNVLLIKDADMFSNTNYKVIGGVMVLTNCLMLLMLFLVCGLSTHPCCGWNTEFSQAFSQPTPTAVARKQGE